MFKFRNWLVMAGVLLAATPGVHALDLPQQDGVEVLARGPVHEAYAEPVAPSPTATPVVPKEPPALIEEMPADQRPEGDNVQWIPGYWAWDEDRSDFLWVSGIWRVPPPGRQWVPGHWNQVAGGWQWVPGLWAGDDQGQMTFLPPPPDPIVAAPSVPAPSPESVAVPGTWVYRENRYLWRPGYWMSYRPGWVWVPAHYLWTPCGYVFVEGYWDFPLRDRGLLFAPVALDPRVCSAPGWSYQPRYVVQDDCLQAALFVRPGWGHYYFGDYFDARYGRMGFSAWVDFGAGRRGWDPLFSYYRWDHRNDRGWESGLRDLYGARFHGDAPRPPRTLVQQITVVNNISNSTITRNVNINNVNMLAPLSQVSPAVARLRPVTPEQRLEGQRGARQFQALGNERARLETQVLARGAAPSRSTGAPGLVTVDLPKIPAVRSAAGARTPPPSPVRAESRSAVNAAPAARPQPADVRGTELKARQPEPNRAPVARPPAVGLAPSERTATTPAAKPQPGTTHPEPRRPQPQPATAPVARPPAVGLAPSERTTTTPAAKPQPGTTQPEPRRPQPQPAPITSPGKSLPSPADSRRPVQPAPPKPTPASVNREVRSPPPPPRPEAKPPVSARPAAKQMAEPTRAAPKPAPAAVRSAPRPPAVAARAHPTVPAPQVKSRTAPTTETRRPSAPANPGHASAQPSAPTKGGAHAAGNSTKGKSRG